METCTDCDYCRLGIGCTKNNNCMYIGYVWDHFIILLYYVKICMGLTAIVSASTLELYEKACNILDFHVQSQHLSFVVKSHSTCLLPLIMLLNSVTTMNQRMCLYRQNATLFNREDNDRQIKPLASSM